MKFAVARPLAHLHNKFELGEKLAITIGLRSETYFYERNILRNAEKDTSILSNTTINQILPGAGVNYNLSGELEPVCRRSPGFRAAAGVGRDCQQRCGLQLTE